MQDMRRAFISKKGELWWRWVKRECCDRKCSANDEGKKKLIAEALTKYEMPAIGEPRHCLTCGELLVRKVRVSRGKRPHHWERPVVFLKRNYCDNLCARRQAGTQLMNTDSEIAERRNRSLGTPERRKQAQEAMSARWANGTARDDLHRLHSRGGNGLLSDDAVRAILDDFRSPDAIGRDVGRSAADIYLIKQRKVYAHVVATSVVDPWLKLIEQYLSHRNHTTIMQVAKDCLGVVTSGQDSIRYRITSAFHKLGWKVIKRTADCRIWGPPR